MIRFTIKFLGVILLLLVLIAAGLVWVLPLLVSGEPLKQIIVEHVQKHMGKELVVKGEATLSFVPDSYIRLSDVTLKGDKQAHHFSELLLQADMGKLLDGQLEGAIQGMWNDRPISAYLLVMDIHALPQGEPSAITLRVVKPLPIELDVMLVQEEKKTVLRNISFSLVGTSASGNLAINTQKSIPYFKGQLAFDRLNIEMLAGTIAGFTQIADNVKPEQPMVYHPESAQEGIVWDTKPYDFTALRKFNADIAVTANAIHTRQIKIGKTSGAVKLHDGRLDAELREMEFYGGTGDGMVVINVIGQTPVVNKAFSMRNMTLGAFFRDAYGITRLDGIGDLSGEVQTLGKNEAEMIANLQGKASVKLKEGMLRGVDFLAMSNPAAVVSALASPGTSTKIVDASASFQIREGIILNNDLQMQLPFSQITGLGDIDLVNQTVKYRVTPIVGATEKIGLQVPILCDGKWQDLPKICRPDVKEIVTQGIDKVLEENKEVKKIRDGLNQLQEGLGDEIQKQLKGLFGQ